MDLSASRRQASITVLLAWACALLVASGVTADMRLPADVTYGAAEKSPGPVVFSHALHVPLADDKCVACHPALFSILRSTRVVTHDQMNAGRQCGACHDDAKTAGAQGDCAHCHRTGGGK
jgi:c(7)-type cytochrome triheme protein